MIVQLTDLLNEVESHGASLSSQVLLRGFKLKVWERIPIEGTHQHMTRTRCLWYNANELAEAINGFQSVRQNLFVHEASLTARMTALPSHRRFRMLITLEE